MVSSRTELAAPCSGVENVFEGSSRVAARALAGEGGEAGEDAPRLEGVDRAILCHIHRTPNPYIASDQIGLMLERIRQFAGHQAHSDGPRVTESASGSLPIHRL
jgi:hypothetical protein